MRKVTLYDSKLVGTAATEILSNRLRHLFEVPPEVSDYVTLDEDTGVPQPLPMPMSTVYQDVLEDLMGVMTAWAGVLSEERDILEMELKNSEAHRDTQEYKYFLNASGSVESKKKIARLTPDVQKADFDCRVFEYAFRRVQTMTDRLDRFVGVLKYAHKRAQERGTRSRTIPGHT